MQVQHTHAINPLFHDYNHILTCSKLETYSVSVVKSNFGNYRV